MLDMYYRGQPLSEIMNATFSEMKMCYNWSMKIAESESEAFAAARAKSQGKKP